MKYDELCRILDIEPEEIRLCGVDKPENSVAVECESGCIGCKDYQRKLPEFTEEKQMKLLLLFADSKTTLDFKLYNFGDKVVIVLCTNIGTPYSASGKNIKETLCKLAIDLINNKVLTVKDVREIIQQ